MIDLNLFYQITFMVLSLIIGLVVGSFLNVLIYRVPINESIVKSSSHCPKCGSKIKFYDNIPVLSYFILRGKCRNCGQPISPQYPLVELLNGSLWLLCASLVNSFGYLYAVCLMVVISMVIVVAFIDVYHQIIPDRFNIVILVFAIILTIFDKNLHFTERLIGLGFCLIFFGGAYVISKLILKREGLGFGDVKFMCACGLFLGIKSAFLATLIGCVLASIVLLILTKKLKSNKEYPFAPFLSIGVIVAGIFGNFIVDAYLGLFTI